MAGSSELLSTNRLNRFEDTTDFITEAAYIWKNLSKLRRDIMD